MGWSIGFDTNWRRDIGYGVPSECDHPKCKKRIDRGLSYVCGGNPYGEPHGCGLFFCAKHMTWAEVEGEGFQCCERCECGKKAFKPKADLPKWTRFKMKDPSWAEWRKENGLDAHER